MFPWSWESLFSGIGRVCFSGIGTVGFSLKILGQFVSVVLGEFVSVQLYWESGFLSSDIGRVCVSSVILEELVSVL